MPRAISRSPSASRRRRRPTLPDCSEDDVAALQSLLVSRTLNLTDELLHSAAREIEAVMFERVIDRLRAALPDLVAAALREQLATGDD